jgi:hypothetical protein
MGNLRYVKRTSARAKATPGESYEKRGSAPKGTGERFAALKTALAKKGARTPGALAAWIGRKNYGGPEMTRMSVAGRKRGRR